MKARIHPRMRTGGDRPRLEEHIPLSVPFVINIDPSDKCPLKCKFCPTGDHELMKSTPGRWHGPMPFELFQKIVDDICGFEHPVKVLRLYKDGEPLANPRFVDMVRYAKESGACEVVDTTTNAVMLTREKSEALVEAGLDRMNISIYGMNSNQYDEFSGRSVDFERMVENIKHLYEISRGHMVINIKINGDVIPGEARDKFYATFGNFCDEINDEHVMSCWSGFDYEARGVAVNQTVGIYGHTLPGEVLVCPYVFYSFSINSDGTASTCFLDWDRQRLIGDAKTENVVNIWRGAQMRAHQEMMLRGERKSHPHCGSCGQMTHGSPDNIDPHREPLLEKFKNMGA